MGWVNCQEKQKQTLGEHFASPNLGATGSSFTLGALLFSPRKDNFPQGDLLNEAVYFRPCDDGRESGTTIKEEWTWTYHTLGLALSHTCALVMLDHPLTSDMKQAACTVAWDKSYFNMPRSHNILANSNFISFSQRKPHSLQYFFSNETKFHMTESFTYNSFIWIIALNLLHAKQNFKISLLFLLICKP